MATRVTGTRTQDLIQRLNGDFIVIALGGNDFVQLGNGNHTVEGGNGSDLIQTGLGNDSIDGGDQSDFIFASEGDNSLQGGDGDDEMRAGSGDDTIRGGTGNDLIFASEGDNQIFGGGGRDSIFTSFGDDHIEAGGGDDIVETGRGDDFVDAGEGDDDVTTGKGNDTVESGSGNDTIETSRGDDVVEVDGGDNLIDTGGGDDEVTLGSGADTVRTASGDDTVTGGGGADELRTGTGDDEVSGGAGADFINAGAGNDLVEPGKGRDDVLLGRGNDTLVANWSDIFTGGGARAEWNGQRDTDTIQLTLDSPDIITDAVLDDLEGLAEAVAAGEAYTFNTVSLMIERFERLEIIAPVIANDDTATTEEGERVKINVVENDIDLFGNADRLTDNNADLTITEIDTSTLTEGVEVTITENARSLQFDPGTIFDDLAPGETATETLTYTVADSQGFTDSATVVVTILGVNDPVSVTVEEGDSSRANINETNAPLTADGTLTVVDEDAADRADAEITGVESSGFGEKVSDAELLDYFSIVGNPRILSAGETEDSLRWEFDSGSETFDFLPAGSSATARYTITVTDNNGGSDTQDVVVTIRGTNDAPTIGGDRSGAVDEESSGTSGTLTIDDPDDGESFFIAGNSEGSAGTFSLSRNGQWDYALFGEGGGEREGGEFETFEEFIEFPDEEFGGSGALFDKFVAESADGTQTLVSIEVSVEEPELVALRLIVEQPRNSGGTFDGLIFEDNSVTVDEQSLRGQLDLDESSNVTGGSRQFEMNNGSDRRAEIDLGDADAMGRFAFSTTYSTNDRDADGLESNEGPVFMLEATSDVDGETVTKQAVVADFQSDSDFVGIYRDASRGFSFDYDVIDGAIVITNFDELS